MCGQVVSEQVGGYPVPSEPISDGSIQRFNQSTCQFGRLSIRRKSSPGRFQPLIIVTPAYVADMLSFETDWPGSHGGRNNNAVNHVFRPTVWLLS